MLSGSLYPYGFDHFDGAPLGFEPGTSELKEPASTVSLRPVPDSARSINPLDRSVQSRASRFVVGFVVNRRRHCRQQLGRPADAGEPRQGPDAGKDLMLRTRASRRYCWRG